MTFGLEAINIITIIIGGSRRQVARRAGRNLRFEAKGHADLRASYGLTVPLWFFQALSSFSITFAIC